MFDDYVLEPNRRFLAGKSILTLVAGPREPISIAQVGLYKPSDVSALLNLSATVR